MSRTAWLIPLGAIAGSAAVLIHTAMQAPQDAVPDTAIGTIELESNEAPVGDAVAARGAFAAGLQAHEAAAGSNNLITLRQMIENLAGQPGSVQRDSQLHGLLAQFATIDAWEAARLAERLELDADALATVFRIWADTNSEEALFELSGLWPPATQRAVALAMLDVYGANSAGVETIAAAFPEAEGNSFRIDAIGEVALTNPDEAMAMADDIFVSATQTIAQQRIATVMAATDPQRALEYGSTIRIAIMRQRYMDRLLDSWAKVDPDGMFSYMEEADLTQMTASPASFRALATMNPEKLLTLAENFAPAQRESAQAAALQALAAMDPAFAYEQVNSLPASASRDQFINNIARAFAEERPDEALTWVSALDPPSPVAFQGVLAAVAADQPARVAEAIIADILNPASANRALIPNIATFLNEAMRARSPEIAQVADRLASHSDPRVRMQLDQVIQRWPQTDPEAAMAWAMRNPSHLSSNSATQLSQLLASENPALARQTLQRVPEDVQPAWIQGTARGMAQTDFEGTLSWLESWRDQPTYEQALSGAVLSASSSQPELVVQFLEQQPEYVLQAAPMLVSSWANQDPAAAAEWLSQQPSDNLGGQDLSMSRNLTMRWALQEPADAESWASSLPPGDLRDGAYTGIIQGNANRGNVDPALFEQLGTAEARSQAVMSALPALRSQDESMARQLVGEHIEDPEMRTQAEQYLDNSGSPSGLSSSDLQLLLRTGGTFQSGSTCIRVINGNTVVSPC